MRITINGNAFNVTGPQITYEEVNSLVGQVDGAVNWRAPGANKPNVTGVLQKGVPVDVVDGMAFTCVTHGSG